MILSVVLKITHKAGSTGPVFFSWSVTCWAWRTNVVRWHRLAPMCILKSSQPLGSFCQWNAGSKSGETLRPREHFHIQHLYSLWMSRLLFDRCHDSKAIVVYSFCKYSTLGEWNHLPLNFLQPWDAFSIFYDPFFRVFKRCLRCFRAFSSSSLLVVDTAILDLRGYVIGRIWSTWQKRHHSERKYCSIKEEIVPTLNTT